MANEKPDKSKNEKGKRYDHIFRENASEIFLPLVELELKIKIISYEPLQEKITRTLEREMDFLYKVKTDQNQTFLLHIEFQSEDDKEMVYRINEYHSLALRKYRMPIRNVVIYLGSKKSKMVNQLPEAEIFSSFLQINLNELDARKC